MLTTADVYKLYLEEKERVLSRFKKVEEKHLYFNAHPNTWSPELIFRHLIMSGYWMLDYLPGEKINPSPHAMEFGTIPDKKVKLADLEKELNKVTTIALQRMESLTPGKEEEMIDSWRGKVQRQKAIVGLIQHDYGHLGQITWLFKRSTGWTDKEIYGLES
jgi:hypothetical protein